MTSQNTSQFGNKLLIRIPCNEAVAEEGASKSIVTVQLEGDLGTKTEIKISSTFNSDLGANMKAETVISIQRTSNNQDETDSKHLGDAMTSGKPFSHGEHSYFVSISGDTEEDNEGSVGDQETNVEDKIPETTV